MKLFISIMIPLVIGFISGFFTASGVNEWYTTLNRPSFNPPNWLFGPVWTTLYILMGISLYLVWKQPASDTRNSAIWIFALQLTLNFFWSIIFFYWHQIGIALIEIIVLWGLILLMIYRFYHINPTAAWLNIPYLLWVSFATVLNAAYWKLN